MTSIRKFGEPVTLTGLNGTAYRLDTTTIGSGGEGDIFRAFITKVAKVYKPSIMTQELEEKLKIMIENPPSESVLSQVAWPLDMIYDDSGQCAGFIMSELSVNAELGEIYKYPSTLPISVHQKINIAQNICVVISEVHKAGYVFGDFNPRNIGLDTSTGLVSFLDTDTYHVKDSKNEKIYRCNVCAPGYAAPELLAKCSDYIATNPAASQNAYALTPLPTFSQETDNFALAIHIFKLLMNGYTPFGGIIETSAVSQGSPGVGDAAVRRDSYCFKPGYKPQSVAIPDLDAFPQEIIDLFARAFIGGRKNPTQRPTAVEWHIALGNYAKAIVTCPNNPLHQYDSKNESCPYCEADRRFGSVISGASPEGITLKQTTYAPPPKAAPTPTPITPAASKAVKAIKNAQAKVITINSRKNVLAAGAEHSLAIHKNGCLFAWGANKQGQLGFDNVHNAYHRAPSEVRDYIISVSAGAWHTMAITKNKDLLSWGWNDLGQLGNDTCQGGHGHNKILSDVIAVSAGFNHSLAIKSNGTLFAWGDNKCGQLGDGTLEFRIKPKKIMENVKIIAAGCNQSAAITNDGKLMLWGDYESDCFFDDEKLDVSIPICVLDNVVDVSFGVYHALAVTSDGDLWAWGDNEFGQIGDCTFYPPDVPTSIMGDVVKVSAGDYHTMAITSNGDLWAWGQNKYGQLGDGTKENSNIPRKIMSDVVAVSAGANHTLAITANGKLWAWGNKKNGKLGDGSLWGAWGSSSEPIVIMENMMIP